MTHALCRFVLRAAPLALLCAALPGALSGCLAVNAMFGVLGLVAPGPIQYAGTAYTVGEYTYQYAVNDKTPDEVLGDKFAWLMGDDAAEPGQPDTEIMLAQAGPPDSTDAPAVQAALTPPVSRTTAMPLPDAAVVLAANAPSPDPMVMPLARPADRPADRRADRPARPEATTRSVPAMPPAMVAAVRPGHVPDPLAARLDRMESALAQAEQMSLREPDQGVRYAASAWEAGPAANGRDGQERGAGVSGAWAIRHPVMQPLPGTFGPLPMAAGDAIQPAA
ncbi:MAG: hypothetical protein KUA35_01220 [Pseudodesulfovibrio sp.]|uniref:Lipoprotein n=1 Tax=Pseudodesulfovibrio aespoeensis (strain ATCC 700646 / DSM 10631 / Aspo-2) TaxID=643562 RepID=E6VVN9_PSEA9|nr:MULTISPECIES: hypothetical protein [Pseudodesulfovibrio]MBU4192280.1 hypothetical protein [Pseudomonadota bacterium]ADU61241.1 hypothetical protein Daes_0214 [Pseudodesulfovibrio aespoeensis Aspo-2]MBU4245105.1 hypothetical protein [Pseudomonadota bacterium]MBU4378976.1 hypothetical protein [Pseudomonadota bacterium]MBU4474297.1 hypothetical protein [Pseudomonadota bacterium]